MADRTTVVSTTKSSFPFLSPTIQTKNNSLENKQDNSKDSFSNYDMFFDFKNLYSIYPFVFLGVGAILNTLSFLVVLRPSLRRTSTGVYLAVLAISDTLVLLGLVIEMVSNEYLPSLVSLWFCRIIPFIFSWNTHVSAWMLVAMTTERLIAIAAPLKVHKFCTRKRAAISILVIIVCFAVLNSNMLWTMDILRGKHCARDRENYAEFWKYYIWIDLSLYSLGPGCLLLSMNSIIIHKLRQSAKARHFLTSTAAHDHNRQIDVVQRQLTITLLLVTFAFVILTLPNGIHLSLIFSANFYKYNEYNLEPYVEGLFRGQITGVFLCMNHSFNFVFYCLGGRKFRQELCNLFQECIVKLMCIDKDKTVTGRTSTPISTPMLPIRSTMINTSYTSLNSTRNPTPTPSPILKVKTNNPKTSVATSLMATKV